MRITVLDGHTLNPGDLSWDNLEQLGEVTLHDHSAPDEVLERAAGADAILVNKVVLSAETIAALSDLKYIGVTATGFNIVDVDAAAGRGIPVCNVPTYGTRSVAQMVFAHILEFTQNVGHHDMTVRGERRWASSPDFCYWDFPLVELAELTMGIVGLGRIGTATAQLAVAFGMNVIACDLLSTTAPDGIKIVEMDEVFEHSDVISLHCPLTPDSENLVNAHRLSIMKPTAFLVNTSRGALIDSEALAIALNSGQIAGAGLDVLEVEPPPKDHPLYTATNCRITPHIAWATQAARRRLLQTVVDNVAAFQQGKLQNVVNGVEAVRVPSRPQDPTSSPATHDETGAQ
ncbi:MAG: D-2-hydroxyacid dehydrogenase [Planctomycetaceae bacterium]|jgi:glycerate dehydrogenase